MSLKGAHIAIHETILRPARLPKRKGTGRKRTCQARRRDAGPDREPQEELRATGLRIRAGAAA